MLNQYWDLLSRYEDDAEYTTDEVQELLAIVEGRLNAARGSSWEENLLAQRKTLRHLLYLKECASL